MRQIVGRVAKATWRGFFCILPNEEILLDQAWGCLWAFSPWANATDEQKNEAIKMSEQGRTKVEGLAMLINLRPHVSRPAIQIGLGAYNIGAQRCLGPLLLQPLFNPLLSPPVTAREAHNSDIQPRITGHLHPQIPPPIYLTRK